jgi:hypothetical protein
LVFFIWPGTIWSVYALYLFPILSFALAAATYAFLQSNYLRPIGLTIPFAYIFFNSLFFYSLILHRSPGYRLVTEACKSISKEHQGEGSVFDGNEMNPEYIRYICKSTQNIELTNTDIPTITLDLGIQFPSPPALYPLDAAGKVQFENWWNSFYR